MCRRQINERCTTRCAVSGKKSYGCITPLVGTARVAPVRPRTSSITGNVCSNGSLSISTAEGKAQTRRLCRAFLSNDLTFISQSYFFLFWIENESQSRYFTHSNNPFIGPYRAARNLYNDQFRNTVARTSARSTSSRLNDLPSIGHTCS